MFVSKYKTILPTAATVKFVLRALIVSLALRSSNSRMATRSLTVLSPSSEYLVISNESKVAWLEDRAKKYLRKYQSKTYLTNNNILCKIRYTDNSKLLSWSNVPILSVILMLSFCGDECSKLLGLEKNSRSPGSSFPASTSS